MFCSFGGGGGGGDGCVQYGLDLQRMVTEKAIYAVLAYLLDGKHLTVAEEKKCRARWIRKVARL